MLRMLCTLGIGLFWAIPYSLMSLFEMIRVGRTKYYFINRNAVTPRELSDEKYGEHKTVKILNRGLINLHYVISGPENAPLMVMLHGFPEIWYSWRHQIIEFQKDFRVVALDMRGFGDSDKPVDLYHYELDVLVGDVKLLIEKLGYESCVLVGHDWGGCVAWAVAEEHPDMVDRLIVMNMCPAPLWYKVATSNLKQFICSGYIFFFFLPFLPESYMTKNDLNVFRKMFNEKIVGLKSGPISEDELECYKHYYRRPGAFSPGINYYRANLFPPAVSAQHSLTFPMPVHVIWGMQDPFLTHKLLKDTLDAVPHATVTRIDDSSHWVQNDRPGKVARAIREFLKDSGFGLD